MLALVVEGLLIAPLPVSVAETLRFDPRVVALDVEGEAGAGGEGAAACAVMSGAAVPLTRELGLVRGAQVLKLLS